VCEKRYKETKRPLPEIARELGVDAVVEGTVMRSGDHDRVTAQLIDARSDRHLWAETYERNLRDVLALQAEVSRDIATEVKVKLTPQEQARLSSAQSIAPETYEAYLKGHYYYEKLSVAGFREALRYYQEALNSDSNYAPAYVALADAYTKLGIWNGLPSREAASKADPVCASKCKAKNRAHPARADRNQNDGGRSWPSRADLGPACSIYRLAAERVVRFEMGRY